MNRFYIFKKVSKISDLKSLIDLIIIGSPYVFVVILLYIVIQFILNPEKAEKWGAILSKAFSAVSTKMEKIHISKDIQYRFNTFRKEINRECNDLVPYKTEIKFVKPANIRKDRVEHKDDKVIIVMKDRKNQDENFVRAAILSTDKILIPNSRKYIDNHLMKSIDLQFIRNLILATNKSKLNFFIEKWLAPELKNDVELENKVRILDKLTELGVFTRILLQELKDYGLVFYPRLPDSKYFKEPNEFFETLQELANKQHQIDIKPDYIGKYIKVSMVMVGRPGTVFKSEGIDIDPYIKWIFTCEEFGYKTIYLLALKMNITAVKKIEKFLDMMSDRFEKVSESNFNVKINNKALPAICIRYYILKNL